MKTKTINLKVTLPIDVSLNEDDIKNLKILAGKHSQQINNLAGNTLNMVKSITEGMNLLRTRLNEQFESVKQLQLASIDLYKNVKWLEDEVCKPNGIAMNNIKDERIRRGSLDSSEEEEEVKGDAMEAQVEGNEEELKQPLKGCNCSGCEYYTQLFKQQNSKMNTCRECGRILNEELNGVWHCATCDARTLHAQKPE